MQMSCWHSSIVVCKQTIRLDRHRRKPQTSVRNLHDSWVTDLSIPRDWMSAFYHVLFIPLKIWMGWSLNMMNCNTMQMRTSMRNQFRFTALDGRIQPPHGATHAIPHVRCRVVHNHHVLWPNVWHCVWYDNTGTTERVRELHHFLTFVWWPFVKGSFYSRECF